MRQPFSGNEPGAGFSGKLHGKPPVFPAEPPEPSYQHLTGLKMATKFSA
jgi:hypothetical protein